MFKTSFATFAVFLVLFGLVPVHAQHKPEVIERGKKATALVEVSTVQGEATGSAFCIDKAGLFITNSHVVRGAKQAKGSVHVVVDIGLKTQRSIVAKVLRADDSLDLALLKSDANSGLTALELGKDDSLLETAPVITFGFPFGRNTTVRGETYPDITVLPSHITSLRRDHGRLEGVQFDGQLNPGNSGGPVVDESGRVIGVAVATVRGAAMNLAIPVGRLTDFLAAPGVVFDPPPLAYKDRSLPVTWTIKVLPPKPDAKLPEKLAVTVTVADGISEPRTIPAQSIGNGEFRVKVTPVPGEPDQRVELDVRFPNGQMVQVQVKDGVVKVGNAKFVMSDLQFLFGGATPRVHTRRGGMAQGPIVGLGKVKTKVGKKTVTIDLNEASQITVRRLKPPQPVQAVEALVEAKQGTKVLATVLKRAELGGAPAPAAVAVRVGRNIVIVPRETRPSAVRSPQNADDDRLLKLGGVLNVDGVPRGAGKAIQPPTADIGAARTGPPAGEAREVRRFLGHTDQVMDLAISPDGKRIVTGSFDATVRVWDAETGKQLHVMEGHRGAVMALAISPNGRQALSGGADQVLRLWDLESGRQLRQFEGHGDWIFAIAFTPDGRRAVSAGGGRDGFSPGTDKDIWLRDLETGAVLSRWRGHTAVIDALAVSPDGRLVLSSSSDRTARLWDITTGKQLHQFTSQPELALQAVFSPDGRSAIVTAEGHLIRVFDVKDGKEQLQLRGHGEKVDSLAVSPDSRTLVSGSWPEKVLRIWDLNDGRPLGLIRLDGNPQLGAFMPDGHRLFWSFSDRTIREFELPEMSSVRAQPASPDSAGPLTRKLDSPISNLAIGGAGRYLALSQRSARKLAVFDVNAVEIVKRIDLPSDDALVAAGANMIVIASPDAAFFERWDLKTMTRQGERVSSPIKGRLRGLAMGSDSDGPLLAVWSPDSRNAIPEQARFSFLETKTFKVLKAGGITNGGFQGIGTVSPAGGSIRLHPFIRDQVHVRASAAGDLYAIWHTDSSPSGFQTLAVSKNVLNGIYNHDSLDHLAPGPDGRTVFTGRGGVLDAQGKPVRRTDPRSPTSSELAIPTADPAYYLSINGPGQNGAANSPQKDVTVSVHSAADGTPLLIVKDLDELEGTRPNESWIKDDFTVEKRFHLIPAANLLITIPYTNDRLVLRRLDVRKAVDSLGGARN